MAEYRVLVTYPKEHGGAAWLSVKGKSRWDSRDGASYHVKRVRSGAHQLRHWTDVQVKKISN